VITVRSYDARVAWTFSGLGDASDYPGKIRALAAAFADRAAISSYSARRFRGLIALLADLLTVALWAVFPVLPAPVDVATTAQPSRVDWPAGWVPRRLCDRLTARRTTGPPCPARPMTPGGFRVMTSP
jgi:hypothetical protein